MGFLKMTEAQNEPANTEQVKIIIFFMLLQNKLILVGVSGKSGEFSPVCYQYKIRNVLVDETATEYCALKCQPLKQALFQCLYSHFPVRT